MPKISVLMSVYNENEDDLMQAVNSILYQTYSDFEFIIVCDNPSNKNIVDLLNRIQEMDSRISVVWNEKNMGLAMSLNHGYEYAEGDYIARMDADDISEPERLKKQLEYIEKTNSDLVWSSYQYIDEAGKTLNNPVEFYKKNEVIQMLPLKNIVHHPTVMMKKASFENAGKYRNFPCAQDYDLWLRMLTCGMQMVMMKEVMLKYRVRQSSTTNRKKYQQICTLNYIRSLYRERMKYGHDSYSYDHYVSYMDQCGVGNKKKEKSFFEANKLISESREDYRRHRYIYAAEKVVRALIISGTYRSQILLVMKRKLRRK